MPMIWKNGRAVEATEDDQIPAPPTASELDAKAAAVADTFFADRQTAALGLVVADVIERAFGVSQSVARQQVKDRFRAYYRGLLG